MKTLRFILGDQLSPSLSALKDADKAKDIILMAEVMEEATYVPHHKHKLILIFSAMRHYAELLRSKGYTVEYTSLDDKNNTGSLAGELARAAKKHHVKDIVVTYPGEYRVLQSLLQYKKEHKQSITFLEDDRFICSTSEFSNWAANRKQLTMEYFYREMRLKTGFLVEENKPLGGHWNFDKQNRKPAKTLQNFVQLKQFKTDDITDSVIEMVNKLFPHNMGSDSQFTLAVTHKQAETAFAHFCDKQLCQFGDFQDAMLAGEAFLNHSRISFYLNIGLLDPRTVCQKVEYCYKEHKIPINSAEGFIRQIIGWREFIRGVYWLHMPEYRASNFFQHSRKLPAFYWTADTKMNCLKEVVGMTIEHAYSHHIQRLMVTGNFALLAGLNPAEVHEWYLAVYADAYEWVELPNTVGMALFADGGVVGSKPYVSSGAYINKMSNFCQTCTYKVKEKTGSDACPYNFLYWNFLIKNKTKLASNNRMRLIYKHVEKMSQEDELKITQQAEGFLEKLNR